jgi:hypothetical protein
MNACTTDTSGGNAATCTATCAHAPITACGAAEGCCPPGCTIANDPDCCAAYELCNGQNDDCVGGIDDGCPSGIMIQLSNGSPTYGGGGGSPFPVRACTPGDVFIGFDGRAGSSVDRLQPVCSTLTFTPTPSSPETSYAVGTSGSTLLVAVGGGGGNGFNDRCPANQVVIGIYGHQTPEVERFGFICGTVAVSRTSPSGPWQIVVTRTVNSPLRGSDNSSAFEYVCPPANVVTVLFGRAAERVDQIGVGCSPMTLLTL